MVLTRILYRIVAFFKSSECSEKAEVVHYKLGRNSLCYCRSGKKYKNCHFIKNNKKGKVAFVATVKNGEQQVRLLKNQQELNIQVKNTLSETEIGSHLG